MADCECRSDAHTDVCVAVRVRAERVAQGLPPTVTDPSARARVASIVVSARPSSKAGAA